MVTIYKCNGERLIRWTANDPNGGPPHLVLGASPECCCCEPGVCLYPDQWRIVDAADRIYAAGPIGISGPTNLDQLPQPFTPIYYWDSGLIELRLQVLGCSGEGSWDTIEEFSVTVTLCGSIAERYPAKGWIAPGVGACWDPPADCACENQLNDPCVPCPPLCAGQNGTGQEWRNPMPGEAKTFTGTVDGEWTNLNNWEDVDGRTPAMSLPTFSSQVIVAASVTSKPDDFAISVGKMTITADGEFHVAAYAALLDCAGLVGRASTCPDAFGDIATQFAAFTGEGTIEGRVTGDAIFSDTSKVAQTGILDGYGSFFGDSENFGLVTVGAYFAENADNSGRVTGDAEFKDSATNKSGAVIVGNADFDGPEIMNYGSVEGNARFDTSSQPPDYLFGNAQSGTVLGSAVFEGGAVNLGAVYGDGTFEDISRNYGNVRNGTFSDTALNPGTVNGDGTFSGSSSNSGSVTGNATFSGNSENQGSVGGVAFFNAPACNNGGTAASFNPDPPPECI
jgi:hypothetical protein